MDVNYEIWGRPGEWQNISDASYQLAEFKIPAQGVQSYYDAYIADKLTIGEAPTDISLAFWGIGKGSIICHPAYMASYWDNNELKTTIRQVYENPKEVPMILNYAVDPDGTPDASWHQRYAPNPETEDQQEASDLNGDAPYMRTLITSFNYQKVMLVPYVRICWTTPDNSSWHSDSVPLKTYIDNKSTTYANYGKIVAIGYKVAVGDGVNTNRTTGLKELGHVYPVNYEGSEETYQATSTSRLYKWFSTPYGINTIECSYTWSGVQCITPYRMYNSENYSTLHTIGDADTGLRYRYCVNYYAGGDVYGQVPIYYYNPDDEIWKINDIWNSDSSTWAQPFPYIEVTDNNLNDVKNYVMRQIAYLGFPFVYDPDDAVRGQIGDVGVFLPVFDEDGITTGNYEEGEDALALDNADWIDGRTGSGYDPIKPPIPTPEDKGDIANVGASRRFHLPLKVWCLFESDVEEILTEVNDLYQHSADPELEWQRDFQGTNPSDYIVGCYAMLLTPPKTDTTSTFTLGPVDFDGQLSKFRYNFTSDKSGHFSFGQLSVPPIDPAYGDFRDYAPYTQIEVYIPLCGTVELDPAYFIGHSVAIDMWYDVFTMSCVAAIYRVSGKGKTLYKTVNGNIGVQVPMLSRDMGDYQNTIHALESAHKQNENRLMTSMVTAGISAAIAVGTGGAALPAVAGIGLGGLGLLNTLEQQKQIEYQLDHTQPAVSQTGVAEAQNSFCVGQLKAKLVIKRAYPLSGINNTIYSKTVGNACCITTTVGSRSGLIVCSNIKCDGIPATLEEINLIKQAFASGVYV